MMHLGYFAPLQSHNTLLIDSDAEGLQELRTMFLSLATKRIKRLVIHRLPFVTVHHATELRVVCGAQESVQRDGAGNSFSWESSSNGWREAADKLGVLVAASTPCHIGFGGEDHDIVVVVSKGEYGEEWWRRHG